MATIKNNLIVKVISIVMVMVIGFYLGYQIIAKEQQPVFEEEEKEDEFEPQIIEPPKLKIIDVESNSRPIAIMIDNIKKAMPQAGLQEAFIIYEIIVEGGQTRLMALFKDKDVSTIGPVRSARHYFVDYVLENDAYYAHYGSSPQALDSIKLLKVNNLNGTQTGGSVFWRDRNLSSPHNVFTGIENLMTSFETKKYRMTTEQKPLLNYSIEAVDLNDNEAAIIANLVNINYSSSHKITYEYDEINGVYKRSVWGMPHIDKITNEQYTFKNIIVYSVKNFSLGDPSNMSRQDITNLGIGEGYYITNGYAIPITWEKTSHSNQTIYRDSNGDELTVNDGNTFIHIKPISQKIIVE
jgi:hypothetical protein